jgi:hypothetical protein
MRDIVATIQAEQDEIIRLNHPEVLVIEGGPGTGKTVVALHRVILLGVLLLQPHFSESLALSPVAATSARLVSAPPQRPAQDPVGIGGQPPHQRGQ